MQAYPSFYDVGDSYNNYHLLQEIMSCGDILFNNNNSNNNNNMEEKSCCVMSPRSAAEAKAMAASKSHSEAERRRRKRINGHLSTLRTLLPNTIKTDKASLLAEAVRCVRELKKTTAELAAPSESSSSDDGENNVVKYMFPSETDELKLSYYSSGGGIKAAVCCEDRPEIITELARALKAAEGTVVRAEMATVGGRIKCVLWLHVDGGGEAALAAVRRALKAVVDRSGSAVGSAGLESPAGTKRQRLYQY